MAKDTVFHLLRPWFKSKAIFFFFCNTRIPHAPFFTLLVDFGYPLRRNAVFLRYLGETEEGLEELLLRWALAAAAHRFHQASEGGRLQHQRVKHFLRLFSHVQQHCGQGSKVRHWCLGGAR